MCQKRGNPIIKLEPLGSLQQGHLRLPLPGPLSPLKLEHEQRPQQPLSFAQ